MPDIQELDIQALSSVNVNVPRAAISCVITDSDTGEVLFDFTGADAIHFPAILKDLTAAQRRRFVDLILPFLIRVKISQE